MRHSIRPLIAAALLIASAPLTSASGEGGGDDLAACIAKDQIDVRKDNWTRIKAPKTDEGAREGAQQITAYATPPNAKSRIYSTNSTVVKVSANAGCTWLTMWDGDYDNVAAPNTEQDVITHLAAPTDTSLWVASYDSVSGQAPRPHVYLATGLKDETLGTASFQEVQVGAPLVGVPVALAGSPTVNGLMYLLVEGPPDPRADDPTAPARRLYVTKVFDSPPELAALGLAWGEVTMPDGFYSVDGIMPAAQGHGLWAWKGDKYVFLEDSRADEPAWSAPKSAGDRIVTIDVTRAGLTTFVLDSQQGGVAARLTNGNLARRALPTSPLAFTHGSQRDVFVVTGKTGVHGYDTFAQRWVNITPKGAKPFREVHMPSGAGGRIVLALEEGGEAFYRFDTYPGERFLPPVFGDRGVGSYDELRRRRGTLTRPELTPLNQAVTVTPGELKDVPVTFRVPSAATPLDVFFLMDTTASMQPAIDGLKESVEDIARELRTVLGKDACFGLAEVKDYNLTLANEPTYRRRLPITCESDKSVPKLRAALAPLDDSGGGDKPEAQTIGLTQAVTGKGSFQPPVDANQDAEFRAGAFKVIVLITDADFKKGAGYPTIDQTIQTLNTVDAKVVSVQVQGNVDAALVAADLQAIAIGTETLAPSGGVDCDGDGQMTGWDLPASAPLVCEVSGADPNIGPAIVGLLLAVTDPGTLSVDVQDKHDVVKEPIRGRTSDVYNLKLESSITFALPIRCSAAQDGLDLPVGLVPAVRGIPTDIYGEVIVRCRSNPVAPPRRIPPAPPEEPVFDPPRPQRPPVAIVLPQPPPAPAQPISNINLNAGLSQEEEQQYQLAAVTQDAGEQEQQDDSLELAMSDYRARDAAAAGGMFAGATLLSAGAAVAYRRRTQRAQRPGYVRTR